IKTFMQILKRTFSLRAFISFSFLWKLFFVAFTTILFLLDALHESYPDEFDNLLGGKYILHGRLLYTGFFTHHGPVPYYLAAFLELFSRTSFVHFRIVYAFFLVAINFLIFYLLKKRVGLKNIFWYPLFIVFLGVEATYYWSHMLLADNLAAYAFLPVYALLLIKSVTKQTFGKADMLLVSICSAIGLYSSLTYLYLFFIVAAASLMLYYESFPLRKNNIFSFKAYTPIGILALPHIVFGLYLLVTGSVSDYIFQNFTFNAKYYIYNYPRPAGSTSINPLRYAIVIAHDFFDNFQVLLLSVKDFNISFPLNLTMAIANAATLSYLLVKKNYKFFAVLILWMIYVNARSNPLVSSETDYQAAGYIFLSFFNLFFILPKLYEFINDSELLAKKVLLGSIFILLSVYTFFSMLFFVRKFADKYYPKYMGQAPLIYNRPEIAPIINLLVSKNEYMWIGPFEFEELFYTNGKTPSKYDILIPGFGKSEKVQQEMLSDFENNPPKVMMYDKNFFVLGSRAGDYGKFLDNFISENYITLLPYKEGKTYYRSVAPIHEGEKVDIETKLYIRKDVIHEVIQKLLDASYIKKITS
ncbi:MAG: hypothetical protein ACREGI_02270, partial [Candidatus Levyibacteriota bacterium]